MNAINTNVQLRNLKPAEKRYELADKGCSGLRIRVAPTGRKTFVWYARQDNKRRVVAVGEYPDTSLQEARTKLGKLKKRHANGELFMSDNPNTVGGLAELFYRDRIIPHRKRPEVVRYILDKDILPVLGKMKPDDVSTVAVGRVIDRVVKRGATSHAGKVLAICKQLFKFAESRGYIEHSPAYSLDKKDLGVTTNVRDRYLNADEIKLFWNALDLSPRTAESVRLAFRILLLSGVRSGELIHADWRDINLDEGTWFIPESNSKTTAWTVPLSDALIDLFRSLELLSGGSPYVLNGTNGRMSDKVLAKTMDRLFDKKHEGELILPMPKATPHDLRRTMRTHLDDLGIEPHVAERCLNHSLGRIQATYNRNELLPQRLDALNRWAERVSVIVDDRPNVVSITA